MEIVAREAILFWIESYGKGICKKETDIDLVTDTDRTNEKEVTREINKESIEKKETIQQVIELVNLEEYEDDDKLPKSLFKRDFDREKLLGINEVKVSAFRDCEIDDQYQIKIVGEVTKKGKKDQDLLMYIVVHNDSNEVIGVSLDDNRIDDMKRKYSFSTEFYIASGELLKDITISFTYKS